MDNQPPLTSPDGSSHGNPPERCPRPLYSWDSTQEGHTIPHHHQVDRSSYGNPPERCPCPLDSTQEGHTIPHHHQSGNLRDPKVKEITREDGVMEESDIPKGLKDLYQDTTVESSSYRNPPERCPPPLYSLDSTQEGPITIPHHHQGEDLIR
ncbi:unnamed protein product [Staurois parvus]|uniref:Prolactin receptor n=1 Tax=Staurois parvus TaxID=386267 RepID=A0ABN9FJA3_9NEOB|nr:unnamed protein product [Staurois parvus]